MPISDSVLVGLHVFYIYFLTIKVCLLLLLNGKKRVLQKNTFIAGKVKNRIKYCFGVTAEAQVLISLGCSNSSNVIQAD